MFLWIKLALQIMKVMTMTSSATKSYEYNVSCDVCGFKYKASELRPRWDGFMVCDADWEPRNILDFYRNKSDVHKLPYVRPDNEDELTWTMNTNNITETPNNGAITETNTYLIDTMESKIRVSLLITVTVDATTTASSAFFNLPTTPVTGGTTTVFDSAGNFLGNGVITGGDGDATLPDWALTSNTIIINGIYGT